MSGPGRDSRGRPLVGLGMIAHAFAPHPLSDQVDSFPRRLPLILPLARPLDPGFFRRPCRQSSWSGPGARSPAKPGCSPYASATDASSSRGRSPRPSTTPRPGGARQAGPRPLRVSGRRRDRGVQRQRLGPAGDAAGAGVGAGSLSDDSGQDERERAGASRVYQDPADLLSHKAGHDSRSASLRERGVRLECSDMAVPPLPRGKVASPPAARIRRGQLYYPVVKPKERVLGPSLKERHKGLQRQGKRLFGEVAEWPIAPLC
jgi:hypothetical protein